MLHSVLAVTVSHGFGLCFYIHEIDIRIHMALAVGILFGKARDQLGVGGEQRFAASDGARPPIEQASLGAIDETSRHIKVRVDHDSHPMVRDARLRRIIFPIASQM